MLRIIGFIGLYRVVRPNSVDWRILSGVTVSWLCECCIVQLALQASIVEKGSASFHVSSRRFSRDRISASRPANSCSSAMDSLRFSCPHCAMALVICIGAAPLGPPPADGTTEAEPTDHAAEAAATDVLELAIAAAATGGGSSSAGGTATEGVESSIVQRGQKRPLE